MRRATLGPDAGQDLDGALGALLLDEVADEAQQRDPLGRAHLGSQRGRGGRAIEALEALGAARVGDDPHRSPEAEPPHLVTAARR